MFPSPALLPVELVRSALKRKASAVAIQIRSERIEISDDGAGIGTAEWQALACLGDTQQDAAAREKAMAVIQDRRVRASAFWPFSCRESAACRSKMRGRRAKSALRIENGRSEARQHQFTGRGEPASPISAPPRSGRGRKGTARRALRAADAEIDDQRPAS